MTAFDQLVTSLVTSGMAPGEAAALVARAVIEATAKAKTSGASRTARWRERHKTSQNVTGASSLSTVTATSQASQSVTSDATQAENAPLLLSSSFAGPTEEKKERDVDVLSSEPPARTKRGARLSDDWLPSETDRKFGFDRGLRLDEIDIEATKFRNYWTNRADKRAAKLDWSKSWQNWILNMRGSSRERNSVVAASDRLNAKLAEFGQPDMLTRVRGEARPVDVRLLSSR
jgi:hypothetical protein